MASMQRVSNHTGVYQRPHATRRFNGRPDTCFYVTHREGQRKVWTKIGWRSEGVTAAYAAQRRAELTLATRTDTPVLPRLSLAQAYRLWYERHAVPNTKSPAQADTDFARVPEELASRRLDRITPLDLEALRTALLARGLAPQTVHHTLALIRRVYRKCRSWGLYSGPIPTSELSLPKADNARTRWLTPDETRALLAEVLRRSERTYLMALASLHTGARFSEIARLRGENLRPGGCLLELYDTKHGSRAVPMTPTLAYELSALDPRPGQLLFPSRSGGVSPEPSDAFTRAVQTLGLNNGIEDRRDRVVFHTLRHTFGSWLAQQGVPLYTISRLMGHSVEETTRRYAKLSPDVQAAAVRSIESALHG